MDPFTYLLSLEKFGIKFGLANIRALAAALGNPQEHFRSVLIAGTNGKGSVTAMVDSALRAAGLRTGRYTSPHLVRLEERFVIDGRPVFTDTLAALIEEVRDIVDRLLADGTLEAPPTFFEVTTAIAFELFRRAEVDVAVLEVGLGGRLDSTNIVEPVVSAITSIDFDHQQYLGNTLGAIAGEKAGVMRRNVPVVVGPVAPEARRVLESTAAATGARFVDASSGVTMVASNADGRTSMNITTAEHEYGWITLGLRGDHQVTNAVVALRVLEEIQRVLSIVTADAIVAGLRGVRWPGRLQMIDVSGGGRVLLDAAHNPAGAAALARYLTREFPQRLPIVFGAMRDKDVPEMLAALLPAASTVIVTQPSNPRAYAAEELATIARQISPSAAIEIVPAPARALEHAWAASPLVCAAGSIFLIGDILAALGSRAREL